MNPEARDSDGGSDARRGGQRAWVGVLLGVLASLGLAVWSDLGALSSALSRFPLALLAIVLALTVGNQVLRFLRWEKLLDRVDVEVPRAASARIFTSGLAMVLTPGKLGEVWKGWLVRDECQAPLDRTIPVVGVERLTDVLGLLALSLVGVLAYGVAPWLVLGLAGLLAGLVALVNREPFVTGVLAALGRLPLVGALAETAGSYYRHARPLLTARTLATATLISIAGWSLECAGTWLVLQGLGVDVSPAFAAFAFAVASIVGALSMLPGGLGPTEASMAGLLVQHGIVTEVAAAATLLVRFATLWFVAGTALLVHAAHRARGTSTRPSPEGAV